jgi:hypothetical protein
MSKAIGDVIAERIFQYHPLGHHRTFAHDDEHTKGELADAAAIYAAPHLVQASAMPWSIKLGERRHDLVRAAALLIAEIERLDRAALK